MTNPKEEIRNYLMKLIHRLLYIKGLNYQLELLKEWETADRIVALEKGSYFFRLVAFSFNRTILIELCMLFDDKEEKCIIDWLNKAKKNANIIEPSVYNPNSRQREILKAEKYIKIITEQQKMINSMKVILSNIKGIRDKTLAHSDARYFNNTEEIYQIFPLTIKDIKTVIDKATEILRMQHVYLFKSDLDIKVHAISNIDTILVHTRAFDRVWHDKRAESLYPILYKLDDYEERLKEHLKQKTN
jgi:hypothetical protein